MESVTSSSEMCVLDEGMITSNEPGVYCEGKFGIRHENEMVVVKGNVNNYGQFMHFGGQLRFCTFLT